MTRKLGVVMDALASLNSKKDSTLAMLQEAQTRGYELYYLPMPDLFMAQAQPRATAQKLHINMTNTPWYQTESPEILALDSLDVILMRKDPPFNLRYIYATYILECAQQAGVLVVNGPQAVRDANEKFFTLHLPQCRLQYLARWP